MTNEEKELLALNKSAESIPSWPISPIPGLTTSFTTSWLFLVEIPPGAETGVFPTTADLFTIDMDASVVHDEKEFSWTHLSAMRIANPFEGIAVTDARVLRCAAFKVDVPRSWKNDEGGRVDIDLMSKLAVPGSIEAVQTIRLSENNQQLLKIQWDCSSVTFESELEALRYLTEEKSSKRRGPSVKSLRAFSMIQNFHSGWRDYYDLFSRLPHLRDPGLPRHKISPALVEKFKSFNSDHISAFEGLGKIPNGLYFVNGCPGAGKTEWNMVVAALIQAKRRYGSKKKRSQILFLVDINKTVDDAAYRYSKLCREADLPVRIVRMHGWPREMRHSVKLHTTHSKSDSSISDEPDFTQRFLTAAGVCKGNSLLRLLDGVPTLDEAAWEYFDAHKKDNFSGLDNLLQKMSGEEILTTKDWRALRGEVRRLYLVVLSQVDFIATTPVAACGRFSKCFQPDIIFVDEASHARELTTLIPIAYFTPLAWIFTGDVKQTSPFVKDGRKRGSGRQEAAEDGIRRNPFARQLRTSTMARADAVDAINSRIMVNRRAYGNLHKLSSKIFYNGLMTSSHTGSNMFPPSVMHLRQWLERIGSVKSLTENRIIVHMPEGKEQKSNGSFYNQAHQKWLLEQVESLLEDTAFMALQHATHAVDKRGTVMIATPYRTAARKYSEAVRKWADSKQERVEVLTVDRAQGNEADIVFLDLVRTDMPGFMDDPQRLNVAITRAKQAEVILMNPGMTWKSRGQTRTSYLSQVWDDSQAGHRIVKVEPGWETCAGEGPDTAEASG